MIQLEEFKRKQGHTRVPRDTGGPDGSLSAWLRLQKSLYKKGQLEPKRADILKELGVEWNNPTTTAQPHSSPTNSAKKRKVTGAGQTPQSEEGKDEDSSCSDQSAGPLTTPMQLRTESIVSSHGSAVTANTTDASTGNASSPAQNRHKTKGENPDSARQNIKNKPSKNNSSTGEFSERSMYDGEIQGMNVGVQGVNTASEGKNRAKMQINSRLSAADDLIGSELEYVAKNKDSGDCLCMMCARFSCV